MWIKNSKNRKDAMLTFATISFAVVTLNLLLATVGTLNIGDKSITFQHIDSGLMATYLGATFTAYVSRRWMDIKSDSSENFSQSIIEGTDNVSVSQTNTTTVNSASTSTNETPS